MNSLKLHHLDPSIIISSKKFQFFRFFFPGEIGTWAWICSNQSSTWKHKQTKNKQNFCTSSREFYYFCQWNPTSVKVNTYVAFDKANENSRSTEEREIEQENIEPLCDAPEVGNTKSLEIPRRTPICLNRQCIT